MGCGGRAGDDEDEKKIISMSNAHDKISGGRRSAKKEKNSFSTSFHFLSLPRSPRKVNIFLPLIQIFSRSSLTCAHLSSLSLKSPTLFLVSCLLARLLLDLFRIWSIWEGRSLFTLADGGWEEQEEVLVS